MKNIEIIKGQKVFWKWKDKQSTYSEQCVLETNGKMIALADSEYSSISSWFNIDDIDLIIKDMSKESK